VSRGEVNREERMAKRIENDARGYGRGYKKVVGANGTID
jgi:hypothetical protein